MSDTVSDPKRLLGMLCTGERLRAFAAVVLGARTRAEVGERAELPAKATLQALTQLEREGLVERSVAGWEPRADTLREAVVAADASGHRDRPDPARSVGDDPAGCPGRGPGTHDAD